MQGTIINVVITKGIVKKEEGITMNKFSKRSK